MIALAPRYRHGMQNGSRLKVQSSILYRNGEREGHDRRASNLRVKVQGQLKGTHPLVAEYASTAYSRKEVSPQVTLGPCMNTEQSIVGRHAD